MSDKLPPNRSRNRTSTQAKLVATPPSSAIFRFSQTEPLSTPFPPHNARPAPLSSKISMARLLILPAVVIWFRAKGLDIQLNLFG
ncbi:hypothetical protein FDENT_8631 [Fusarium denticulatum]|uniref:Uncharacterized protein n=1 Tax=Fusarium denticulatum TaxID=48507 RepID=A0A8H5TZM0_9HYPO|nr:hypothetical protein FDENT_8631 [Fusarium denticulatum]